MAFVCIYCRRGEPDVGPSESHIFPHVIGGTAAINDAVCKSCNNDFNQQVEMPAVRAFRPFQSIFGIRGRSGRMPGVPATASIDGTQVPVYLDQEGRIPGVVVVEKQAPDGKKGYLLWGPKEAIEAKQREMMEKDPTLKWEPTPIPERIEALAETEEDLSRSDFRRLASKVAFERFVQLRSPEFLLDHEFDVVRTFVLNGAEGEPCCGVLSDERMLLNLFQVLQPPHHTVYILAHPGDRILGAFVGFYGIFYYWVILSRRYRALGTTDDLFIEDPQARVSENPLLRARVGRVIVPWMDLVQTYLNDPKAADKAALSHAMKKFQAAADQFYEGRPPRS